MSMNISMDVFTSKVCPFLLDTDLTNLKSVNRELRVALSKDKILTNRINQLAYASMRKRAAQSLIGDATWARSTDFYSREWNIMPPPRPPEIDYIDAEEVD